MKEGCDKLGWDFRTITRNADRERYDADLAGLMGFGDVTARSSERSRPTCRTPPTRARASS